MVILLLFNITALIKTMLCVTGSVTIISKSMKSVSSTKPFVQSVKFVDELTTMKKATSEKVTKPDHLFCLLLRLLHIYVLMTNL